MSIHYCLSSIQLSDFVSNRHSINIFLTEGMSQRINEWTQIYGSPGVHSIVPQTKKKLLKIDTTLFLIPLKVSLRWRFMWEWHIKEGISKTQVGKWRSEAEEGRKPIKNVFWSPLPLWSWSCWRTLRTSTEFVPQSYLFPPEWGSRGIYTPFPISH